MNFYIVATPIGNFEDITIRALNILKTVDFVVCEHGKEYKQLCLALNIPIKEYIECQRKSETEAISIVDEMIEKKLTGALVSDCGTPLFEDPGFHLLSHLRRKKINLVSLPGANSIITALPLSQFEIKDFYFAGFISQKKEQRELDLKKLLKREETIILLETPYRLLNLMDLLVKFCNNREMMLPYNVTMSDEKMYRGKPSAIKKELEKDKIEKGEFLIILSPIHNGQH
ncbi:MAG: hypothetical protein A2015_13815 [Spirochaetes bacterium GWF1_31_7]|nr:MAG: hypothetical protein A2Y30_11010 [Spirochaetes bacterium GWE1_32_154]OHD46153.1 MAG: hypothetical protein A2Y29_08610 [Spirochaetes bacterium GWE2_31_10]OHD49894.1 MAG: hypothetical protein A2015_13815 [Spirochaetes bacterium GWF1_31_7]OHD81779.1 MAG: hypothetical protein A2355_04450 [Spirochaetes bacterium RIFOXYB1_FULL_32_8]HBD96276.1 16S rRNA (cytidine(1402)-2'-O)-methyltransferase [Spirochaetia bacterium]